MRSSGMILLALTASLPIGHLPACGGYVLHPTSAARAADAHHVNAASHKPTPPAAIDTVMGVAGWRIVWARPAESEPGAFVFRGTRFVDVWGGVTDDRDGATAWATKLGMPAALARCFAARLVETGP